MNQTVAKKESIVGRLNAFYDDTSRRGLVSYMVIVAVPVLLAFVGEFVFGVPRDIAAAACLLLVVSFGLALPFVWTIEPQTSIQPMPRLVSYQAAELVIATNPSLGLQTAADKLVLILSGSVSQMQAGTIQQNRPRQEPHSFT